MNKLVRSIIFWLIIFIWGYCFIAYLLPLDIPALPYSTVILDRSGKEIGEIIHDQKIRHRPLTFEEIPRFYQDALITLEDRSFWSNNGISLSGLVRSTWNNLKAGKIIEGGSTLSSGLIRNALWLNEKRDLRKKIQEFVLAIRLNHLLTKKEILTEYTNRISFGYLNYGLASASRYYFAKSPENLTKAEQIALITIPKDPKKYNPYTEPKAFRERFSGIVDTLEKSNILSPTEAKSILEETLDLNYTHSNALPYVADFIDHGYEKWHLKSTIDSSSWGVSPCETTWGSIKNGDSIPIDCRARSRVTVKSPEITTTIDADLTDKIDTLARNTILDLSWKDVSDYGVIILDRATNELRVMIGWVNYHASEGQVNSTLALRQPGSTIKPFTYLLGFEHLGLKPDDMILDLPTAYKTSEWYEYDPKNYSLDYKGQISIAEALSQSINIPAVKMADMVGVDTLLRFLHTVGMKSLTSDADHYGLGLTLGNGEVSLYELTRAYSIFAHEGKLCDIRVITENTPWDCQQIASPKSVSDINLILTNRYFKLGGFPVHSSLDFSDRNVFVKTGTSRNFRDNWAVGFTDNYIIGVWAGNKNGAFMKGVSGATGAGEIFSRIVYTLDSKSIDQRPVQLEGPKKQYLEILSPLPGSVFMTSKIQKEENQRIKLTFRSNYDYDAISWLLDGKKVSEGFILPKPWSHTIECALLKDGAIIASTKNLFDIRSTEE